MAAAGTNSGVDQNLYSRQIGVFGMETMGKLIQMDVLIVGLKGVGVETAKNLILAGPRSVTLFDPEEVKPEDLGSNYYLNDKDIGNERSVSCASQLAELNSYVQVSTLNEKVLSEDVLGRFHAVVFTSSPIDSLVKYNNFCRNHNPPIGFIACDVRGVAGRAFVDFGPSHKVIDPNGEPTKQAIVVGVVQEKDANSNTVLTIQTHDSKRHGLSDGDSVIFRELEGASELNDGVPRRIRNCTRYSFEIVSEDAPSKLTPYVANGVVEQAKVPVPVSFGSLQDRIVKPIPEDDPMGMMLTPDLGKFGRPEQLHVAMLGLDKYVAKHNAFPPCHDADAIVEVKAFAKQVAADIKSGGGFEVEADDNIVDLVVRYASTELPALCAFFGGIIAQEVVKLTGKFSPLRQWLYLDAFELCPSETQREKLGIDGFAPSHDRYNFSNVIFGAEMTKRIREQRVFVVGAGALGCEFLKNYALMGVGTSGNGKIYVTDMDNIETSNLNRQFLFRSKDVGKAKSTTAAAAAMDMNPELRDRIEALETAVGPDTENTFNEEFWTNLNFVTNALDNLKARTYVDDQCVWYGRPLLESGTLGTKANTQVIVPFLTESYSDQIDPPEESIPMCTLKNFPNAIEHCIEWSRDNFEGYFTSAPQDAKAFATNPHKWLSDASQERNDFSRRNKLEAVRSVLRSAGNATWETCVAQARRAFESDYSSQIRQLLYNFPPDHVTSEGAKFWSGPKRMPSPANFDINDPLHCRYVAEAAALFATIYGISVPSNYHTSDGLRDALETVHVPEWQPKTVKIKSGDDDNTEEGGADDAEAAKRVENELRTFADSEKGKAQLQELAEKLSPAEFEKDDDSNHHIDFIAASANLRAANYNITAADRHKVKMIAGKIIPAIATTTCMVTGLVIIEAYKIIQQMSLPASERKIEPFRNSFVNLAVNVYSMSEPGEPKRVTSQELDPIMGCPIRSIPEGHSKWDRLVVHASDETRTVQQLINRLCSDISAITKTEQKSASDSKVEEAPALEPSDIEVTMVLVGSNMLYSTLYPSHKTRLERNVVELYEEVILKGEGKLDKPYLSLSLSAETEDGCELAVPPIQYFLH